MISEIAIVFYVLGLVAGLFLTFNAAAQEPTAHGQSIIVPIGLALSVVWPLALVWALLVGLGAGIAWIWTKLKGLRP